MQIALAQMADIPAWLKLAAEVEPLFGPMAADPAFHAALERNIARQTAFCIRELGASGMSLMGALFFLAIHAPHYRIGWLAVAYRWRRQGVAQALGINAFSSFCRRSNCRSSPSVITTSREDPRADSTSVWAFRQPRRRRIAPRKHAPGLSTAVCLI
jgi:hypothetical protein